MSVGCECRVKQGTAAEGGVNVLVDNTYESNDFCEVARGQQSVTDGCYNSNRAVKSPAPSMTLTTVVEGGSSGVVKLYTSYDALQSCFVARRFYS